MTSPREPPPSAAPAWAVVSGGILVRVRVQPRSSRPGVAGRHGDALKVRVSAPPVEGAANEELVALLARWLAVPKRAFTIVHGQAGRDKVLKVITESPATLGSRIEALLAEFVDKPRGAG